jgi:hypothetical protein
MCLHTQELAENQRRNGYEERVYGILKGMGVEGRDEFVEMDSLDSTGFVMGLEEEFGVTISDNDATRLTGGEISPESMMDSTKRRASVSVPFVVDYLVGRKDIK